MSETIPKSAKGQEPPAFIDAGVQPDYQIRAAIKAGMIQAKTPIDDAQIQPASLDLRLGEQAWRLRASFLPRVGETSSGLIRGSGETEVEHKAQDFILHQFDLQKGAVLESGCVYLVKLQESLNLPAGVCGRANPKSSIGRIDVFTRLVTDYAGRFDTVTNGYHGPLYAEISPRTFPILVRPGDRLNQLRFVSGQVSALRVQELSLDLRPDTTSSICGYRAQRHAGLIDLDGVGTHDPNQYWEPVRAMDGHIVLDPEEFYILSSQENVCIGEEEAAEMAPVAAELGEFRAHYAGFFDPGFGMGKRGSKAVLEVRPRDMPFVLGHEQIVARLEYWPMATKPRGRYGKMAHKAGASNYQGQGLRLSKYFKPS